VKTLTLRISGKLDTVLGAAAREEGVSKSALIRKALEEKLARHRRKAPRVYDLVGHLSGSVKGPRDLLTNPKYMIDFGK